LFLDRDAIAVQIWSNLGDDIDTFLIAVTVSSLRRLDRNLLGDLVVAFAV